MILFVFIVLSLPNALLCPLDERCFDSKQNQCFFAVTLSSFLYWLLYFSNAVSRQSFFLYQFCSVKRSSAVSFE